jgi:hypothetical protein
MEFLRIFLYIFLCKFFENFGTATKAPSTGQFLWSILAPSVVLSIKNLIYFGIDTSNGRSLHCTTVQSKYPQKSKFLFITQRKSDRKTQKIKKKIKQIIKLKCK